MSAGERPISYVGFSKEPEEQSRELLRDWLNALCDRNGEYDFESKFGLYIESIHYHGPPVKQLTVRIRNDSGISTEAINFSTDDATYSWVKSPPLKTGKEVGIQAFNFIQKQADQEIKHPGGFDLKADVSEIAAATRGQGASSLAPLDDPDEDWEQVSKYAAGVRASDVVLEGGSEWELV